MRFFKTKKPIKYMKNWESQSIYKNVSKMRNNYDQIRRNRWAKLVQLYSLFFTSMFANRFWLLFKDIPVTAILADQLAVPSKTADSAWSIESMCVSGSTLKITLHAFKGKRERKKGRMNKVM